MEEIKFKNTSKLDAQELSLFQQCAMKKMIWASSIAFAVLFAGAGAAIAFWQLAAGVILVVCGIVGGFFFLPYLLKENQKKQNEAHLGKSKYLNTFSFYEDRIHVQSELTNGVDNKFELAGEEVVRYEDILKVVTYKDRLFLFVDARQAFIVNFNSMTQGTISELIAFLKEKQLKFVDKTKVDLNVKKK